MLWFSFFTGLLVGNREFQDENGSEKIYPFFVSWSLDPYEEIKNKIRENQKILT